MKIAIAGGTGFVGKALTKFFLEKGYELFILTRKLKESNIKNVRYVSWLTSGSQPEHELDGIDAFINLAGEPLNSGRWTETRKERIYNSRIHTTREVLRILSSLKNKPSVLINASAIGYYGTSLHETFTEDTQKHGHDFLAEVVWSWEEEAKAAEGFGIRVVYPRFGIILGKNEGALNKMILPYHFFIGGTVGSGEQWLSWVHIDDVVGMIDFSISNTQIEGAMNVTSPHPMKMQDFGKTLGNVIGRPHWLPAPSFALKLLLGEMSMLVLEGQRVLPEKAEKNGYEFSHSFLDEALSSILKS
ncbi:TIGR01777 family oxidoreductase [Bacillus salitolerans]|uniref:TIGR01777 family oxidoreductase n=1 Tax=Bacillus salitolerans TaxID=1437434 RepID=A0ABW4LWW0_9BACI